MDDAENFPIGDKIKAYTASAVEKLALGDEVSWEVIPAFNPEQGGLFYVLVFTMPSSILGTHCTAVGQLNGLKWTPEIIEMTVANALEHMRTMRTKQLSLANGQQQPGV